MSSTIAYTICTASHLGQAKTMADSLVAHNPEYKVIIGLVDKISEKIDLSFFHPHEILLVEELQLPEFEEMKEKYSLLGLTCALKSYYGSFLLEKYAPAKLIYIDTDIFVFDSFDYIDRSLDTFSIIVSPHIRSPYPDDNKRPAENVILNVGNFNGGFIAMRNDENTKAFLDWWKQKMKDKCYEDPSEGLFDDQIWLNFVPIYFNNVRILDHDGYNVAYWNLHEKKIERKEDKYSVNQNCTLAFFHFSGYSVERPGVLARQNQTAFSLLSSHTCV
jgi:lipopolysaccharide biosynthesis glycosyltransferase